MKKYKTLQKLFADPKRWIKGDYAKSKSGRSVDPTSKSAVKFCLLGGLQAVHDGSSYHAAHHKIMSVSDDFVNFNDAPETTIKDIQILVKKAKV